MTFNIKLQRPVNRRLIKISRLGVSAMNKHLLQG